MFWGYPYHHQRWCSKLRPRAVIQASHLLRVEDLIYWKYWARPALPQLIYAAGHNTCNEFLSIFWCCPGTFAVLRIINMVLLFVSFLSCILCRNCHVRNAPLTCFATWFPIHIEVLNHSRNLVTTVQKHFVSYEKYFLCINYVF